MVEQYLTALESGEKGAFFIIDVDNFKAVNDVYGHLSGDVMLADIAGVLQKMFRSGDYIGRIGGDEFLVFLCNIDDFACVTEKAEKVLRACQEMFVQEQVSCSIGIALAPEHGADYFTLYKHADVALYHAKTKGKNTYAVYTPEMPRLNLMRNDQPGVMGKKIDSEKEDGVLSNKLAEYVFHVLYQSVDIETVIPQIMEIIGRQFDVSRVYIFEDSDDGEYCNNTFEWCNQGIEPQKHLLQHVKYAELDCYYSNFNEDGIFYCRDIQALSQGAKNLLQQQGIKSVLQCIIQDNGRKRGFVGFDECKKNRIWTQAQINSLTMIAEMVSIFLLKKRAQIRTAQTMKSLEIILDHQQNWIYVIRKGTFELLYANRQTRQVVPDAAKRIFCYEAFFQTDTVCENCPVKKLDAKHTKAESLVYSKVLDQLVIANATVIPWSDGEEAYLISCHQAEEKEFRKE